MINGRSDVLSSRGVRSSNLTVILSEAKNPFLFVKGQIPGQSGLTNAIYRD